MIFSTLGATGMGSLLKVGAGIIDRIAGAKEAHEKREMIRDLERSKLDVEVQKMVFGDSSPETSMFARQTRRILAVIGMINFFVISVLCTLFPSVELITFFPPVNKESLDFLWGMITIPLNLDSTVVITTGHITLVSIITLAAVIGFYFTPGGRLK
jgi:hypothetical protein